MRMRREGLRGSPVILGVGNPVYGDDGAGYCVAMALKECGCEQALPVPTLTLGDAALLEGADPAIIIDVADWIEGDYGVYRLSASGEELAEASLAEAAHEAKPIHVAAQALALGLASEVYLVLVRPERLGFGEGPSREVLERALRAARKVIPALARGCDPDWGCVEEKLRECEGDPTAGLPLRG